MKEAIKCRQRGLEPAVKMQRRKALYDTWNSNYTKCGQGLLVGSGWSCLGNSQKVRKAKMQNDKEEVGVVGKREMERKCMKFEDTFIYIHP
jgi:hypothetical protein